MTGPGAFPEGGRTRFRVWAPGRDVSVRLVSPDERVVALEPRERGWHEGAVEGAGAGARYFLRLDGGPDRPDPASRSQPLGVHGPSEVVDPAAFRWTDAGWRAPDLADWVTYELHVGVFTPEGTFAAAAGRLGALKDLGVTAVELMPVAQFPGGRNWGYDGVHPYAAQDTYGGPAGLAAFVDAAHAAGLAVVLDVVYNHLGPEGNYLAEFGPYFTEAHRTPWGPAVNLGGAGSDEVRAFLIENALWWLRDLHVDALRLDAVHALVDLSVRPFLAELSEAVRAAGAAAGRPLRLIAESDANDPRLVGAPEEGGLGLDAVWNDDFHHALRALLTGERRGWLADFGRADQLARAFQDGFVFAGEHATHFGRRRGRSSAHLPGERFVVFSQNHDQVGNRPFGDRLAAAAGADGQRLAAAAVLLAPCLPLLFMGEEYGETAPFLYFTSHGDAALAESVRRGRAREFADWQAGRPVPDPQAEATFAASKLAPERAGPGGVRLRAWYAELLRLRRTVPALRRPDKAGTQAGAVEAQELVWLRRRAGASEAFAAFHFGRQPLRAALPLPAGGWTLAADSADGRWGGPGACVPRALVSGGAVDVVLPPRTATLFIKD